MILRNGLFLFCLIFTLPLLGQEIQWASEVLEVSSELTPVQYSAKQVTGRPNVFPNPGENPNAWTPARPNKKEFIKVKFDNPMKIRQILIGESYNPTAVSEVYTYDPQGNEYLVGTFRPKFLDIPGRPLNLFFELTEYEVAAVKVVMDGGKLDGYHSIDAIGISDSNTPVTIEVNVSEEVNPEVVTERLSENVNSEYTEYKPLLSPDGKTLFFSRRNHPENIGGEEDSEDIWYSEWDEETGTWTKAQNMGNVLNNESPNFISSITADGNTMVLLLGNRYLEDGKMLSGVSISTREDGEEWSKPEALNIENEYNFSKFASFTMSNDREVILMSVEREDTRGDRDLYVSFVKEDGSWTEPLNLGDVVNTAHEESAPFLAEDNTTLYFSSQGYSGFGGNDIYVTRRLDNSWTKWSEPENLGPGINSAMDDVFFNIPTAGDNAYYSKGMSEDNLDIFSVSMPTFYKPEPVVTVKGKVSSTDGPIQATLSFVKNDGSAAGETQSNEDGTYEMLLPAGNYTVTINSDGYESLGTFVDTENMQEDELSKDFTLEAIEEAEVSFESAPLYFGLDKSSLNAESQGVLDQLVNFLKTNDVKVEITGHTCDLGPASYNQKLSERRAAKVVDYLTARGIDRSRISLTGLGESNPINSNENETERARNRRVEIKIN